MSNQIKQIRGQVRQVVKELLPDILKEQVIQEIMKIVTDRLSQIDKKQRDINSYVVRNHASNEPLLKPTK